MPKHDNSAAFREGISYFREFQTTLREAAANALSPIPLVAAVELEELYSTTEIMSGAVTAELTGLSPQVGVGNFIVSRAAVQADRQRHSGFFQRLKVKQPPKQGSPEYKHWKMTIYARRVLLAGAEPSQAFAAQYVQTLGTCPPGVQQAQNQHQSERQQRAGRQRHTEEEREAERQRQAENQREARRQAEKEREAERRQEEQQREQAARAEG